MTRKSWKDYLKLMKDDIVSKGTLEDMLADWKNETEIINKKLNWLMDEIFKLNKEINE